MSSDPRSTSCSPQPPAPQPAPATAAVASAAPASSALVRATAFLDAPDRDRHPGQHTGPAVVVAHLDLPDPGGPAAVLADRHAVHCAFGDRAQEARLVGEPDRELAFLGNGECRGDRGEALRQRRVAAAVNDPIGRLELVADPHLPTRQGVADLEHLEPEHAIEPRGKVLWERKRHESGTLLIHLPGGPEPASRPVPLLYA